MYKNSIAKCFCKKLLSLSVSGITAMTVMQSMPVMGQEDSKIESITVTASRIKRDGYSAPTPVTVLNADAIKSVAPVDISESLALMPQFSTTSQPATAVQYANLRNLGSVRTLVLLDGRRHVPTFSTGVVDLTTIPTALIGRTEIVTGGASASWGSDAVSGVVNLILREDLQGIVGNAQYGESRYGDDETQSFSIAGGTDFASGRGHILVGAEYANADGIRGTLPPDVSRPNIASLGSVRSTNYAAGDTQIIYAGDVRRTDVYDGGLITSGPLRGTTFEPNGQTGQFGYGTVYGTSMIGGTSNQYEAPVPGGDLKAPYERKSFLTRLNYDLTDNIQALLEYNYSESISNGLSILPRNQGSTTANRGCSQTGFSGNYTGNINVAIDNAFLPQSVKDDMVANNITCFNFGRSYRESELGLMRTGEGSPSVNRYVAGLSGEFANGWKWDGYYQAGDSSFTQLREGNFHGIRTAAAIDAVFDGTGKIVCRINIDSNPSNNDPACAPFNLFGAGSPSLEAQRYVTGSSWLDMDIKQKVAAFNVSGDVWEGWAGPIGAALGYEYRKESLSAVVDPDSQLNRWQVSNRKGIAGSYDVNEVYGELAIPLLDGMQFADAVDLTLAARSTDYSSSGRVTTWKAGVTWEVNDQVRLRISKSRDIRAGNLGELYTPTAVTRVNVSDPLTGVTTLTEQVTRGNPKVSPEEGETFTTGVVFSPDFLPGFQLSVDYFSIDMTGQIGTLSSQEIMDQCYIYSMQQFCGNISRDTLGAVTSIDNSYFNLDSFETSGFDLLASYTTELAGGDLTVRVTNTYLDSSKQTFLTSGASRESAGQFNNPRVKSFWNVTYQKDKIGATIDMRWYSGGNINNQYIQGFAGINGTNFNDIGSMAITGLNLSYDLSDLMGNKRSTVFLRIDNLFDREAPFPLASAFNDNYGRGFRGGVNFEF